MVRLTFQSYGVRLAVEINDPCAVHLVQQHLPFRWELAPDGPVERNYSLIVETDAGPDTPATIMYRDGIEILRTNDSSVAIASLESLLQVDVAEFSPNRVFIHAGVVGWHGRAIVLPGRSFTGKTTLVAALVGAGATYYSDEYAVFDRGGRVYPFPRPLGVRDQGAARGRKLPVESLGGTSGTEPLEVGQVVLSTYHDGARWEPRTLSPGEGLLGILENAVSVRRQPGIVIDTLEKVTSAAPVLKGTRGDAVATADAILAYQPK
jgi:hypothetical protein